MRARELEAVVNNDLLSADVIKPKAQTTKYCYKHVIRAYLIERWGSEPAIGIGPADVKDWLKAISIDKEPDGLAWSTLSKMRNIMSLIYADAQRKRLIPDDVKYNRFVLQSWAGPDANVSPITWP
jgi:hypothetical protein